MIYYTNSPRQETTTRINMEADYFQRAHATHGGRDDTTASKLRQTRLTAAPRRAGNALRVTLRRLTGVLSMVILFILAGTSLTYAQSIRDLQTERLFGLLRQPINETSRLDWQRVGPEKDTNELLVQVALDKDQPVIFRGRAIQALAFFPTKRTHQFLWQATYERQLDNRLKKAALRSLGAAFQTEALFELSSFLTDDSVTIREGAVRGLGLIRDVRARTILENHLDKEEDLDVRLATDQALRQVNLWETQNTTRGSAETLDGMPHIGPEELGPLETAPPLKTE